MIEWGRAIQAIGHSKYHTTPKFYERTNFRKLGERAGAVHALSGTHCDALEQLWRGY
jgi:hypothetical protein